MHERCVRILGIDPGTQRAGWGAIEERDNTLALIEYGAISIARGLSFPEKLEKIYADLSSVMARLAPHEAALEQVFHGPSARTSLVMGQARGVALLAVTHAKVRLFEYEPARVKKAVTGNGRAHKEQIQQMVRVILGLPEIPEPHDAADALALAICHSQRREWEDGR